MKIRVGGLAAFLAPFFVFPGVAAAQEGASLTGRALDQRSEEPVPAARVELLEAVRGSVGSVTTDAEGRFRFERLAPGSYRLRASSLGYQTVRTPEIPIEARDTTEVIVWMDVEAVPVAPLQVVVGRPPVIRHRGLQGLYDRAASGLGGSFIFHDEIEERSATRVSDVLITIPSMHVTQKSVINWRQQCGPQVYIDGIRVTPVGDGGDGAGAGATPQQTYEAVNMLSPWDVEGIEVYRGAATVPGQFGGPTAACGVILIWTRRG